MSELSGYEAVRCGKAAVRGSANDWALTVDDIITQAISLDASADLSRIIAECRQLARDFSGLADKLQRDGLP